MVDFLLKRPIAVFMMAFAFIILGIAALVKIPTALLPDIPVPEITVQLSYPHNSARDLETNVVRPLRNQLLQIQNLDNIQTQTQDGFAIFKLYFDYNTDTDLAFIATNEKVDASLNLLPRNLNRPRVIKASATDIPILNITVTQNTGSDINFLELSEFTESVLRKRIEQLPDIALADVSGLTKPEVIIEPQQPVMRSLGIKISDLVEEVEQNNFELGNLIVQNGIYQYNLKFSNPLKTLSDIENIQLKINGRLFKLGDVAKVREAAQQERGNILYNGKKAILISVIKQSNTKVEDLKKSLDDLLKSFESDYPDLNFHIHQDQTELLELSLSNLKASLLIGSLLAISIMFFFLKDIRLPVIIGLSIPASLFISFLFMYLFGLSINIISLSGLILGVGMMIDNTIIILDNISQKLEKGNNLFEACSKGTSEMISPLISSVLTTCMIFLPLLFLSGITGALFYDQALAVSIGLGASLLVSILVIPVFYLQLKRRELPGDNIIELNFKTHRIEDSYQKGFNYLFKNPSIIWMIAGGFLVIGVLLLSVLPYSKLPQFTESEIILEIDWNENVSLSENTNRIQTLFMEVSAETYISQVGEQQFMMNRNKIQDFSQVNTYILEGSKNSLQDLKENLAEELKKYPRASYKFSQPKNLFDYLFGDKSDDLIAQVYSKEGVEVPPPNRLDEINNLIPYRNLPLPVQESITLSINFENLLLYNVDYNTLIKELEINFDQNFIDNLKSEHRYIPIKLNYKSNVLEEDIETMLVENKNGDFVPVKNLIAVKPTLQYKSITGDKAGEFLKFILLPNKNHNEIIKTVQKNFINSSDFGVRFSGNWFEIEGVSNELFIIVLVGVMLLYFIMAAQFESLVQPLIILLEIPIDIGGGLLLLWLFGGTINVMAGIGIVVMAGIVINDSIIKIHTINTLRRQNYSMLEAIKEAGHLRLKPIVMTSLTTILTLMPFLFIDGLGAELQLPLALTVIGGLTIGTFISLYFVPLLYFYLHKNEDSVNFRNQSLKPKI